MVQGDFGESMKFTTSARREEGEEAEAGPGEAKGGSRNPALLYWERMHVTIPLNIAAEVLIFAVAIPVGLAAARFRGRLFDRASTIVLLALWSVPVVLAATLMLAYLGRGGQGLEWFPYAGLHSDGYEKLGPVAYALDLLWHVMLPVVCLVYGGLAYLAKLGRASLLENLRADYVRTARAKGQSERVVVYHHALRNSLLPMITVMVMMLPALIGGSVIVETVFSIPGMGRLVVEAAQARDLSVIMFGTLIFGVLTQLALLAGDLLYAWADPRVSYE
jgi:peptide/nickel transport system permease protein